MKKHWIIFIVFLLTAGIFISIGTNVFADDDDDEKHEVYEEYGDDEGRDHDEDEEDYESDYERAGSELTQFKSQQSEEFWNIWSREPSNNTENVLPITEPSDLTFSIENRNVRLYTIPKNGQLLVSVNDFANLVEAESIYYPKSKIVILKKGNAELIVRAGSNAVFENRVKQPMPSEAAVYEDSIYLPISVAANALSYRVSWDSTNQIIILKEIERSW
ncbi:copper amine oxidase N-terminal domain-containing protein [Neobacillus niacini]|uniref:copper amine oxidase N-terminal domain-containing protein n=1 Tax=Neobacillus niacini TaxID=86668 RepID=UPI002FFE348E